MRTYSCCLLILMILIFPVFNCSAIQNPDNLECNQIITVQKGDTLASICRSHLGKYNSSLFFSIQKYNPHIKNPDRIFIGDTICLPGKSEKDDSGHKIKPDSFIKKTDLQKPSLQKTIIPKSGIPIYPPLMPGAIHKMQWLNDNTAVVYGSMNTDANCIFYVYVPGDLEYEQPGLEKIGNNEFKVTAVIGRQGRDYGKTFVLKLALFDTMGERTGEITRPVIRKKHEANEIVRLDPISDSEKSSGSSGWSGIETWLAAQELDAMDADNVDFRIPNGRLVVNYRYIGYNPDARYLSRYGRVTLYGSSCLAKALLLKGRIKKAEDILRVWAAQTNESGMVPRSANVIGDNYISPDVRTGEIAHFLGAMALAEKVTKSGEWDNPIRKIVNNYLKPLVEPVSGLIRGGYNGIGSEGYNKPKGYEKITWCSAEHNFDLFQALMLLSHVYGNSDFGINCRNMAGHIAKGIDQHLWDETVGTYNRGWRTQGHDRARALDCASWGALYLLKQAGVAKDRNDKKAVQYYLKRADRCLKYAEKNFKTLWHYQTPGGKIASIKGYRPYAGLIDDLRYEDGPESGKMINWNGLNDMVWSEGTLGVGMAWEEYARLTGDKRAKKLSREIYSQMLKLQELSDKGGMLYSTKQLKGHFTMGEELASLGWMAYMDTVNTADFQRNPVRDLIPW